VVAQKRVRLDNAGMDISTTIRDQFHAALNMLEQCLSKCPPSLWNDAQDKNPVWRVIYHVLFFTDLYIRPTIADFRPSALHRCDLEGLGKPAVLEDGRPMPPFPPGALAGYLAQVRALIDKNVPQFDLDGASGFDWIPLSKLGLQFYNIRHIQQHTGELSERLWVRAGIEIDWIGRSPEKADGAMVRMVLTVVA
jgi:hypothetical protein